MLAKTKIDDYDQVHGMSITVVVAEIPECVPKFDEKVKVIGGINSLKSQPNSGKQDESGKAELHAENHNLPQ